MTGPSLAQIIPDQSLGAESSRVEALTNFLDQINGGALRGTNLFHSFQEFSIPEGHGAYFTNPAGVLNIFSRVTGNNPSQLLGLLGVAGEANLFFLNPNGIIFGPNAQLDVRGSFLATTANSFQFADGQTFGRDPSQGPPLLTISVPIGLDFGGNSQSIESAANLEVSKDLTLAAPVVTIFGSLNAGKNLSLTAQNFLTITDVLGSPLILAARENLTLQGQQGLFVGLYSPDSDLAAGGDFTLRSDIPINAMGRFSSGGNFRVETLAGALNSLEKSTGLTLQAGGDVSLLAYQGGSLQIQAGGSITIPDFIWITGSNPNAWSAETVTLSNGQKLTLDGAKEPLADLRAGVNLPTGKAASRANILVGSTFFADPEFTQLLGGTAFFSNQFQPNPALGGDITAVETLPANFGLGAISSRSLTKGGTIALDSRGNLDVVGESGLLAYAQAEAGNIFLNSGEAMNLQGLIINSLDPNEKTIPGKITAKAGGDLALSGFMINFGGDIDLRTAGNLDVLGTINTGYARFVSDTEENLPKVNPFDRPSLQPEARTLLMPIPGGDINLTAQGNIQLTGILRTTSAQQGGDITIKSGGDTVLRNALLTTEAGPGGAVHIQARNLTLTAGDSTDIVGTRSNINAGIRDNLQASNQKAGDINLQVQEKITFEQASNISNWMGKVTSGDGGQIILQAKSITIKDGSQVSTVNQGSGTIGDIFLTAEQVEIDGGLNLIFEGEPLNLTSRVYSNAYATEQGNSGNITVATDILRITNGADLGVENFVEGQGNGGDITIHAQKSVLIDGEGKGDLDGIPIVFGSQIASNLGKDAIGKSGSIIIETPSLTVSNGARISGSVFGQGEGGLIRLNAPSILVTGEKSDGLPSLIDSSLQLGQGKGGDIEMNADRVAITQGAQVNASSFAQGDAGNIMIRTKEFILSGSTSTGAPSILGTGISEKGQGNAGKVDIQADRIELFGGGQIQSTIFGIGNAGEIALKAREIAMSGKTSIGAGAGVSTQIGDGGIGNAGLINIQAERLTLANGAGIDSATFGQGNAGSIQLAVDHLRLNFADIVSSVEVGAKGNGGEIRIDSKTIASDDFSLISVSTAGEGKGGNISINADSLQVLKGMQIQAATFAGGIGDAGNITINAPEIIVDGENDVKTAASLITTTVDNNARGNSGQISLSTQQLTLSRGGQIQAAMLGQGEGGSIEIKAHQITVDGKASDGTGSAIISSLGEGAQGKAGTITLTTNSLTLRDEGRILARTAGQGSAGNIRLDIGQNLNLEGGTISTAIRETGVAKSPSSIEIKASLVQMGANSEITASSLGQGDAGNIAINLQGNLTSTDSTISTAATQAAGGRIDIRAANLRLQGNSDIRTNVNSGAGGGGNITLTADSILAFKDSDILAFARDGRGGDISLQTPVFFGDGYQPAPKGTNPDTLEGNNRVDINASGSVFGVITIPDLTFIQNSLAQFPDSLIDPDQLIANSCVVPDQNKQGNFIITGPGGLPPRPGDPSISPYPTGTVQPLPTLSQEQSQSFSPPLVEAQGVYRTSDGRLLLSRECH
ncbi:filamentous hemagglutinin N-terminal domain-containing protein [Synechocystis sp. LKSZ1]|uniref:two-partner secretion domain-containing protein n=1 Tax=Synechocystis sp. LKSZ1 TaxID=3144951 RepID=UPI00336C09E2